VPEVASGLVEGAVRYSPSSMVDLAICPRRAYFRVVERLRPQVPDARLNAGRVAHAALAHYYQGHTAEEVLEEFDRQADAAYREIVAALGGEPDAEVWKKNQEEIAKSRTAVEDYLRWAASEDPQWWARVLHVEQAYEIPLTDESGEQVYAGGRPVHVHGFFDLVCEDSAGRILVVDHKFKGRFPSPTVLQLDEQFRQYALAARSMWQDRPVAVIFNGIRKLKDPSRARTATRLRLELYYTDEELRRSWKRLLARARMNLDGEDIRPGSHCSGCQFQSLCLLWERGLDWRAAADLAYVRDEGRKVEPLDFDSEEED
jgi:CRISPR/Cas system-associated exonuclease Cas4 (RecB family)